MKIYVDVDSCPVKEEIKHICQQHEIPTYFVSNRKHLFVVKEPLLHYQWVRVEGSDGIKNYLQNHLSEGDIVISHDVKVASQALEKKSVVITFRGRVISHHNIEFLEYKKHIQLQQPIASRDSNHTDMMQQEDRLLFSIKLTELIISLQKEGDL
ncbi:hypothetical protein BHU72_11560 [Desulfuribacillus stibiiarsenatis]|uniref:Uncharacterized protein n=1 Tax=Desulfuribacillus stibiiarsenatis TaxID=1390249 RepID=A0A1E5L7P3_9FIRM|nr:DUF188 domain-containing protein [Desulfuribacillus stibiiarsenatis]OEH86170.1 hypothetical protein BHU72_11560 [Desulfuribacillus stibiiarsenatis]